MPIRADITLTVGGNVLGLLRDADVTISLEMIGAAPEDVYGWSDYLPGARSWTANGSVFVPERGSDTAYLGLKQALVERTTIAVIIDYGDITETGTAVVNQFDMAGSVGGVLEGSLTLTGTGAIT